MTLLYNVSPHGLGNVEADGVVIRSQDPAVLVECASRLDPDKIVHFQLLSLAHEPEILQELPEPIPLELMVDDVGSQYALLYRYADLLKTRPIRVRVPVEPGFGKVVKIATALEFAVMLETGQPDPPAVEEMMTILETYLYQSTMSAPVEFFHSLLIAYFRSETLTIWEIQEEDPGVWRYLTDDGVTVLSKRLLSVPELSKAKSMEDLRALVPSRNAQCTSCNFLENCQGYFKLPDASYRCGEIIKLLGFIEEAAQDLRKDYDASLGPGGGSQP
jgi:hypothetical protein